MAEKRKIGAKIVADSITVRGERITTFLLTYPRMIHAEVMTHRMFSRNAASSRAIPFEKMVKSIEEDPFIPIAWQKDHKGMQGTEYFTDKEDVDELIESWDTAKVMAINRAKEINDWGATKQICNRLLEPFMWYTNLVTATELDNFFELRCPKYEWRGKYYKSIKSIREDVGEASWEGILYNYPAEITTDHSIQNSYWRNKNTSQAEIHIQMLAEAMWDTRNESTPKLLKGGEWHIPFGDQMDETELERTMDASGFYGTPIEFTRFMIAGRLKIATARAARLSYMTYDGNNSSTKDIALHDRLLESKHFSPFEHCAQAMTNDEWLSFMKGEDGQLSHSQGWCENLRGFISYRHKLQFKR